MKPDSAAMLAGAGAVTDGQGRVAGQEPPDRLEDPATWQELDALGCDAIQRHYVSRPVPAEDLIRWLEQHQASAHVAGRRLVNAGVPAAPDAQA